MEKSEQQNNEKSASTGRLIHKFIRLRDVEQQDVSVFISEFNTGMTDELIFNIAQVLYGSMIDHQFVNKDEIVIFSFLFKDNLTSRNMVIFQIDALSKKAEELNRNKELMSQTIYKFLNNTYYAKEMEIYSALYPDTDEGKVKMSIRNIDVARDYLAKLLTYFDQNKSAMNINQDMESKTNLDSVIIDSDEKI